MTRFQRRGREETSIVLSSKDLKTFTPLNSAAISLHLPFPMKVSVQLFILPTCLNTVPHKLESSQELPGCWLKIEVYRTRLRRLGGLEGGEGTAYCDKTPRMSDDQANLGTCPNETGFS